MLPESTIFLGTIHNLSVLYQSQITSILDIEMNLVSSLEMILLAKHLPTTSTMHQLEMIVKIQLLPSNKSDLYLKQA